jgi:ribosomal protein S18 acetylase RimI-like enzyme
MKIEFREFDGPHDWGFVQNQVPLLRVQDTCGIMAVDTETNTTVGAAIFDNFLYNSMQLTFIATTPMLHRHGFIEETLNYAFEHCDREYIYSLVRSNHTKAIRLNERVGFKEKMRIRDGYGEGVDFIVFELCKNDCEIYLKQFEKQVA